MRICFEMLAEFPANGMRRYFLLQGTDEGGGHDASEYTAQHGTNSDINFKNVENQLTVLIFSEKRNVIDPNDFSSLGINDLLIEQVTDHAQHVFVGVIRGQALVLEVNAIRVQALDLVVADAEPSRSGANKIPIYTDGIDQGN